MAEQKRTESGKFSAKSNENRAVRSVRLTDAVWKTLGAIADSRCITRADLIEQIVEKGIESQELGEVFLRKSVQKDAVTQESTGIPLQQINEVSLKILKDPKVTRNGKDRASVRRALQALLDELS